MKSIKLKQTVCALVASLLFCSAPVYAGGGPVRSAKGAENPLQVRGQVRNLNMMLILKNKKEKLNQIEVRRDYRNEIKKTKY